MQTVSVLVPCYNAARFVGTALDSLLAQTWTKLEIIVVNDGSNDGSASVLAGYEPRGVRVIHQANAGQCAAANRAYAACTGSLIKFFDADDVLAADMIERQVMRLAGRSDAVALGEWGRFYSDCPYAAEFQHLPMYRDSPPVEWLATELLTARPMMQCALWLIPRTVLEKSGLWDERLTLINDFEFLTRVLLASSEILYTPGARLYYRSGLAGSLSGRKSRQAVESAFLSLILGTEHLLEAEYSERTRRVCANLLQDFIYTYYPEHADLRARMLARVQQLGGSGIEPEGPPGFHKLRRVLGWRAARRVQRIAARMI